jgi:phenylpropionate dioxygenase-like ring-hydroxylating dioxygenase large terminal subunit
MMSETVCAGTSGLSATNASDWARSLVIEQPRDFRVHSRAYTDPDLFELEMRRIFESTWIYLAHETEISEPGLFKTTFIGRQPVIVVRDSKGEIRVLLNRCRHRGAVVCREERGRSGRFQCPYHGWTYALDGRLTGITERATGYPDDFDQGALGLMQAPQVETYRGLIFASLGHTAPSLIEHLGAAKEYIDYQFDRSPAGSISLPYPPHRLSYNGNWKFQVENATDAYHVNYTHESFQMLLEEFASASGQHGNHPANADNRDYWQRLGKTRGFPAGHGLLEAPATAEFIDDLRRGSDGAYYESLERNHGPVRACAAMGQYHLVIYPNLAIIHGQLRVIRPIAVDRSEVVVFPYALDGIPAAQEAARLRGYERFFGPAGFGQADDMAIFGLSQTGLRASAVEWLVLSRGLNSEKLGTDGVRLGNGTSETPIRAAFRAWQKLMGTG